MRKKTWQMGAGDPQAADRLARALGLTPLAARVLVARGYGDENAASALLKTSIENIYDPFLFTQMSVAVEKINAAINGNVRIAVYGDYDVDGVTATCILMKYMKKRGADCIYYIPDRQEEGYGLNTGAIQKLYDEGCRLLITVDSGITAYDEAVFAAELGMELVITDHHECKSEVPPASAVINPRLEDSGYPFRELAGVGVAFKLICALEKERPLSELLDEYADIVAVGTIADVMPLVGENREIVKYGLKRLQNTKNLGLRALMDKLGFGGKPVTSNSVSFVMAPRINAAGRMGGAAEAERLFLTEDPAEAAQLAEYLCELNRQRQEEENNIYKQVIECIRREPDIIHRKTMVLWGEDWHTGVIGIVASRLSDRYGMPCVLISMSGDEGKGSGRSIRGFNLYAAAERNSRLLDKYGGHELAVGLSIDRSNLEEFRDAIERCACQAWVNPEPFIDVDCMVEADELTLEAVSGLSALEPFGMSNMQPAFAMRDVRIEEITPISHDRHVKLHVTKDGEEFNAFVFGMGSKSCRYVNSDLVDIVFSAEINSYKGRDSVQLIVRDIRWAESEQACDRKMLSLYERFCAGESLDKEEAIALSPTKDNIIAVFRHVKSNAEDGILNSSAEGMYRKIKYESGGRMNLGRLLVCLDIFSECDIFKYELESGEAIVRLTDFAGKADINGSKILKRLMEFVRG